LFCLVWLYQIFILVRVITISPYFMKTTECVSGILLFLHKKKLVKVTNFIAPICRFAQS